MGQGSASSPNKRKNLGSSVTTRCKNWERITILGALGLYLKFKGQNLGYLSSIFLEAKIWGSDMNFRGKIWGQAPRPSLEEVPPLEAVHYQFYIFTGLIELCFTQKTSEFQESKEGDNAIL